MLRRYYPDAEGIVVRTGTEAVRSIEEDADDDIAPVLINGCRCLNWMAWRPRVASGQLSTARRDVPIIALTASVLLQRLIALHRCRHGRMREQAFPSPLNSSAPSAGLTGDHGARIGGYDVT
ncbi:MAG: hypothetical protein IPJ85_16280 [Flavobacteriales bacterium]|nr:hypothetical protein [Flavobacteriales bacterium]